MKRGQSPRRTRPVRHFREWSVTHGFEPFTISSLGLRRRSLMARCAVPARVVAGGTNDRAALAFEGVAPLHAARTSQRDVPTMFLMERERRMGKGSGFP